MYNPWAGNLGRHDRDAVPIEPKSRESCKPFARFSRKALQVVAGEPELGEVRHVAYSDVQLQVGQQLSPWVNVPLVKTSSSYSHAPTQRLCLSRTLAVSRGKRSRSLLESPSFVRLEVVAREPELREVRHVAHSDVQLSEGGRGG